MPKDPFAVPSAFRKLESFIESLTHELRDRRAPLEGALRDLLLVAQLGYGRYELAVRLDAVGAVARAAGLRDEVQRMHAVRSATPNRVIGNEMNVALALLDAAVNEQRDLVTDLLTRLHAEHLDLIPGVWGALGRVADQLLTIWCDLHVTNFTIRFHDEVRHCGLDLHLVEQWHLDCEPHLTEAATRILDRLLDGEPFAIGRLDELPDLGEQDDDADSVSNTIGTDTISLHEVKIATTPCKQPGIPKGEAENRVAAWLGANGYTASNPMKITVQMVANATGLPNKSSVARLEAWKKFHNWREQQRTGLVRTISYTDEMRVMIPDRTAEDPSEIAIQNEEREQMEGLLSHVDSEEERTRLRKMKSSDQQLLLEAYNDLGRNEGDRSIQRNRRERSRCS